MDAAFSQHRFGARTSFILGPEALIYGIGDWRSMHTQTVPYELLDLTVRDEFTIGNTAVVLRWAPLLMVCVFILYQFHPGEHWLGIALLVALVVAAVIGATVQFKWTQVRFTEIGTVGAEAGATGALRIIQDRQHDAILATLETAWRDRLRQLYAAVDLDADPNREAARLDRLRQLGVIEPAEFAHALDRLRAAAAAPPTATGAPLH